ncbi:hypothetical protein INP81_07390 [Comamonas thiooxydans]|uniref:hypothetical protein n=1 Tax=Comamonas thiooxydans TaxID=363952 RepID=UPI0018A47E1A|nr:hypothetical protein [Comamonas thiooxydans]QOQ83690.1 hypothetical protein INP81_07390 [Comamonas thiooxydans]
MRSVAIRPDLCAMCGKVCGMVCAIKSLISKDCALCALSAYTGVQAGACTHMHAGVCMCVCLHSAHSAHSAQLIHIKHLRIRHGAHIAAHHAAHHSTTPFLKEEEMEEEKKRVIGCTPENAAQMKRVVQGWPQLHGLVKQLQAADLFPGMRAMQITLTGSAEFVGQGLDALDPEKRAEGLKSNQGGAA